MELRKRDKLRETLKLEKQSKHLNHVVAERLEHARRHKILRMGSLQEKIAAQILEESEERPSEIGVRLESFYNGS
ncbi:hypothetical protein SYNPS1DRAFT_23722 [Syncephalis pseudoplumigaleata]|uniref:Uncharacterized protein n=1 Tax=Syncephalis pseudoplumigaleata TaxID=1712513 RepID=A0A4P9YWF9_9FUNG|nr:hypothetical protein SYNPS1DRAFT_23722 [Syncephalis pseudoplumigaleata]|eukprot:RKP24188.1 hypothetical protein SYNPS1DRAFT_23722 [Syncephalis pseudoplumigaleata]